MKIYVSMSRNELMFSLFLYVLRMCVRLRERICRNNCRVRYFIFILTPMHPVLRGYNDNNNNNNNDHGGSGRSSR